MRAVFPPQKEGMEVKEKFYFEASSTKGCDAWLRALLTNSDAKPPACRERDALCTFAFDAGTSKTSPANAFWGNLVGPSTVASSDPLRLVRQGGEGGL